MQMGTTGDMGRDRIVFRRKTRIANALNRYYACR